MQKVIRVSKISAVDGININSIQNTLVVVNFKRPNRIFAFGESLAGIEASWWKLANNPKYDSATREKAAVIAYAMKYAFSFGLVEMDFTYSDDTVKMEFRFHNIADAIDFAYAMKDRKFWRDVISS